LKSLFTYIIFLYLILIGSSSFGQIVSKYGNLNWVDDSLQGFHSSHFSGFRAMDFLNEDAIGYYNLVQRDSLDDDTSSFSRISYMLGANANQKLTALLARPISDDQNFLVYFNRLAYPGWMARSFSRGTDIGGKYSNLDIGGFIIETSIDAFIKDNEMNGGLKGDLYSISGDQSQRDFGSISSDVFLNQAYWRRTSINGDVSIEKVISNNSRYSLRAGLTGNLHSLKFVYSDESPDSVFYSGFKGVNNVESFRDSIRTFSTGTSLFLDYSLQVDTNKILNARTSVSVDIVDYSSNSLSKNFINASLEEELDYSTNSYVFKAMGTYYFTGFNSGDIHLGTSLGLGSLGIPSAFSVGFGFKLFGNYSLVEPLMIYQLYDGQFGSVRIDYEKTRSLKAGGTIVYGSKLSSIQLGVETESLKNAVFYLEDFTSVQSNKSINLISPSISCRFDGERFRSHSKVTYQFNNLDTLYSLPNWMVNSDFSVLFRLFKKKVGLEIGVQGLFFSDYYARGYLPMVDQMYIQNDKRYGEYIQIDPFARAQIQSVDISFRYINVTYGLFSDDPLIAPGYPILPRYLQITIDWKFKN